jgi:sugar/nucleoside kinase (ribokinase family)
MPKILCIGDLMMDVITIIDSEIHFGGDTKARVSTHGGGAAANVASWLAHAGEEVYLASHIGDDAAGHLLLAELQKFGITHTGQIDSEHSTGVTVIIVSDNAERTMFPDSGANSYLSSADLPNLAQIDYAYISGYALINPISRSNVEELLLRLQQEKIRVALDPGTVGALRSIPKNKIWDWFQRVDLVILNEEEALYVTGTNLVQEAMTALTNLVPMAVVKRGGAGAVALSRQIQIDEIPAQKVDVVDTTGAGDAFAAGFIAKYLATNDMKAALNAGVEFASLCIQTVGARPKLSAGK